MERLYDLALVVTLWATGLGLGLRLGFPAMVRPARRVGLVARVAVVDVVAIPLLVWGLVRVLDVPESYATGLLLVAAAAAGPLAITASRIAGADAALAVTLVLILEGLNAIAIPVWAALLLPPGVAIPYGEMVASLAVLLLLPLGIGGLVAVRAPSLVRWSRHLDLASSAGLAVVIVLAVGMHSTEVTEATGSGVALVALIAVVGSLIAGWAVGGPGTADRATAALVVGVRANGLALAIANLSFPDDPEVSAAIVVFGLLSIAVPVGAALVWRRKGTASAELLHGRAT